MQKIELNREKSSGPGIEISECVWALIWVLFYENTASVDTYPAKNMQNLLESGTQCLWGENFLESRFSFLFGSWSINKKSFEGIRLKIFNNYRRAS